MRQEIRLTASQPQLQVNLQSFNAAAVFIENPTGSPVAMRAGGTDYPTLTNANHVIPANGYLLVPVDGTTFAFAFTDTPSVTSAALSNLLTAATITLFDAKESLPNFGSATFLSLSLSDLSGGIVGATGATTSAVYDLGSWGGAILYFFATASSGQGVINAQVSSDQTTWRSIGEWAFWPGLPATINVPRSVRYLRFLIAPTVIPGEPAIDYAYAVRATLSEIFDLEFSALSGTVFTKPYAIAALGEANWTFATRGLPAISVGVKNTTGIASQGELIVETANGATGPWRVVAFREQSITPGGFYDSIQRTYANLDLFTRVRMLSTNLVAIAGTVYVGILPGPDLSAPLQQIFAALGDPGEGVNVNQSIYHELDTIRQQTDTLEALIAATNTKLDTIISNMNKAVSNSTMNFTITTAGVWQNIGPFLVPGQYIKSLQVNYQMQGPLTVPITFNFGIGTAGAVGASIFGQSGTYPEGIGPWANFDGPNAGGFLIPPGFTNVWALCTSAGSSFQMNMITRA